MSVQLREGNMEEELKVNVRRKEHIITHRPRKIVESLFCYLLTQAPLFNRFILIQQLKHAAFILTFSDRMSKMRLVSIASMVLLK